MPALNKVMLMGNVTRDIELRYTPKQTAVCEVGLAINEKVKRGDRWEDEVTYMDVTFWGKQAETVAQWLKKGDPFYCEGKLRREEYVVNRGKENERTEKKTKITGTGFQFLGGRRGGASEERPAGRTGAEHNPRTDQAGPGAGTGTGRALDEEDEIPF